MNELVITKKGYQELEKELEYLQKVKRPNNIEALRDASEFGDLRENSEYDAAVHEQWQIESRIQEIETILRKVKIVDKKDVDYVHVGSKVRFRYLNENHEEEYIIVGPNEVDILKNKISHLSKVGKVLMNKKVGDIVKIDSETNNYKIEIVKID